MRHFFFYGTLIAGSGNPVEKSAHAKLRPAGPAAARGRVYAVRDAQGWYPALVPGAGCVRGMLYEAAAQFGKDDLARLDAYEDCDNADPGGSLYLRREISICADHRCTMSAQAYLFNRPLPANARRIPEGDFRAWLARTRASAYSPLRRR
jgi:gamma-glutamylcyclotransferase (GGCT)/AIG2-like uncharacterized protein YtfP